MNVNHTFERGILIAYSSTTPTLSNITESISTNGQTDILFICLYVVAGIILLPGLAGNGLITVAVIRVRKLRTPTNYLLASLAVSDLMMMVVMVGFLSYVLLPSISISASVNDYLFPSFDILVGSASILNLAAVSVDRAVAVTFPLRYESIVTPPRVHVTLRLIWSYSVLMYILAMLRIEITFGSYKDGFIYAAYTFSFIVPFFVMICCYFLITLSAIKSLRVTRGLELAVMSAMLSMLENKNVKDKFKRKQRKRELKTAMTLTVILLPFVCGWGFFFGVQIYELISDTVIRNQIQDWFLYVIPWLNSSLNPIIYILLNRPLRRSCRKLICGCSIRGKSTDTSLASKTALTRLGSKRSSMEVRISNREPNEETAFKV